MTNEKNIERVNLRFNLLNPIDQKIWDFIKDSNKKGTYIKMLLYNMAIGLDNKVEDKDKIRNEDKIDISEIDESAIEGF